MSYSDQEVQEAKDRLKAQAAARKALDDRDGIKDVPFDQGPAAAGKQLWYNVTRGHGPMGLVSSDGSLAGVADQATEMALNPTGGGPKVTAFTGSGDGGDGATSGGGTDPMVSPGGGGSSSGWDNDQNGMASDITFRNMMLSGDEAPKAAPDFYEKEGEAYTKLGGRQGKSSYNRAFVSGPQELERSIEDAEKAQTQKAKELGKVYDAEQERSTMAMAANNHRREADQIQLQQRQAQLEKATQFYTDDLADQGKFWTSPGNIISAIAYALTPMFGNDNTSGIKLINQAVDRDMANRQHNANQTLGALQNNIAGYHKLAGDREAGDLLADSEARRLAANEVARISQKFESPISQAKAQAVIQDLRMRSEVSKMEAYRLFVHIDPSKMPQALHNARASGFDGSYEDYNSQKPGVDPTTANVNGFVDGTPSTASPTGATKNGKWDGFSSPQVAAVVKASPQAAYKAVLDGRLQGSGDIAEMLRRQVAAEAAKSVPPGATPDKLFHAKREIVNGWEKERKEAPELVKSAPKIAATRSIQSKIDIIERSEAAAGRDPKQFLASARNTPGIPSDWVDRYEKWKIRTNDGAKPGSAEDYEQLRATAKQIFRQQMHELVNNYIHENAGGAVSESEAKRMDSVVNPNVSMPEIKAFVRNQSEKAKYEESVALAKMSPGAALYYKLRTAGGNFSLDAPGRPAPKAAPLPGYDGGQSGLSEPVVAPGYSGYKSGK